MEWERKEVKKILQREYLDTLELCLFLTVDMSANLVYKNKADGVEIWQFICEKELVLKIEI